MLDRAFATYLVFGSLILPSGCNFATDPDIPYSSLPENVVASEVPLVVSPSAPTSYLPLGPIPAGIEVQVLGQDQNSAWLLVLHEQYVGWIPSVFSGSNIARIQFALTVELPDDNCLSFLDSVVEIEENWISPYQGNIRVVGSVYRSGSADKFRNATLSIAFGENASVIDADHLHFPLTPDISLVFFTCDYSALTR